MEDIQLQWALIFLFSAYFLAWVAFKDQFCLLNIKYRDLPQRKLWQQRFAIQVVLLSTVLFVHNNVVNNSITWVFLTALFLLLLGDYGITMRKKEGS